MLKGLCDAGMRLRRAKCIFMAREVTYLGHRIDDVGIHPINKKIKAIEKLARVKESQAYCGMINYNPRFLSNLSVVMKPLYQLLKKATKWNWTDQQAKA